jgi:hypothetical protein
VRKCRDTASIRGAPGAVALEHFARAGIGVCAARTPGPYLVRDDLRERRDVAQSQVEALRRDRVQPQRRVADQERALARELLARDARERVRAPLADPRNAAEPEAEYRL